MYFIKKLGSQELGSGTGARGRYIFISKKVTKMFPSLGTHSTNDFFQIQIYSEHSQNRGVFCCFVYHNDAITKEAKHLAENTNGRNEYRLYLNKDIDPNRSYFNSGDIVILKLINNSDYIYQLDVIRPSDPDYSKTDEILKNNKVNPQGTMAIIEDETIMSQIVTQREVVENINPILPTEVIKRVKETIENSFEEFEKEKGANLFTETQFRTFVMNAYKKCALTEKIIEWEGFCNLEAAHIKPRAHEGTNLPCNGIGFSRDIHWAFDKGFFAINDDYTITIHEDLDSDFLKEYDGKKLIVPDDSFFKPDPRYLKHHRENIFGLFKKSGRISKL